MTRGPFFWEGAGLGNRLPGWGARGTSGSGQTSSAQWCWYLCTQELDRSGVSPGIIFNKNLDNGDAGVLSPYSESSILALAAQI